MKKIFEMREGDEPIFRNEIEENDKTDVG